MDPTTFVLFGATGDLAKRKIYPALYHLFLDGKLPQAFSVIGLGRREWDNAYFQSSVEQSLRRFSRRAANDDATVQAFVGSFRYCVLDIGHEEDYRKLLALVEEREAALSMAPNRLFYLSVGPEYFETIAANIHSSALGSANGWKRLVIEKPFGHDLSSARNLNRKLSQAFSEEEIYRIDHYLGKPVVQRMESLQQDSPVLQALWADRRIANVQITANESVGVEERAGYYDHVGALRDMFQNHMLQLLMMAAVYLPPAIGSGKARLKKKGVMQALAPVRQEEVGLHLIRGQYAEGSIEGTPVAGYTSEPGIAPSSKNETFIAARLSIDSDDWRGVPFYIRTGKRMKEKSTRIVVEFKEPTKQADSLIEDNPVPNLLVIEIGPDEGITLQRHTKANGPDGTFQPISVDQLGSSFNSPEAYENLIGDALNGDPTFFAHWDEVELSWQWVQPVLDAFEADQTPLLSYPAGTYGPEASDALLAKDGYAWWLDDKPAHQSESNKGERYDYHANY